VAFFFINVRLIDKSLTTCGAKIITLEIPTPIAQNQNPQSKKFPKMTNNTKFPPILTFLSLKHLFFLLLQQCFMRDVSVWREFRVGGDFGDFRCWDFLILGF